MIVLSGVSKDYGNGPVLDRVSMRIEPGELVCIAGASNAGKSTLLSILSGMTEPTSGTVTMDGVDLRSVPPPALRIFRRRVGIIFQDRKLLPGRTVAEHVAFPLEIAGASDETIAKRVPEVLSRLHLNSRASAFPSELSMGQQTLLAIGRAIAHQPLILIADDPVRDLDAAEAAEVLALLHDMQAKGTTVIVASRDAALATQLNARSLTLDHGALTTDSINRGREAVETIRAAKRDTIEKTTEKVKVRATKEDHALHRKVKVTAIHSD